MSNILCRQCQNPIKFDDKYASHQHQHQHHQHQQQQQGDTINVTKAVVRKSILMQIKKTQSGKWIPLDKDTGLPYQCQ
jgi:hypothetical protein